MALLAKPGEETGVECVNRRGREAMALTQQQGMSCREALVAVGFAPRTAGTFAPAMFRAQALAHNRRPARAVRTVDRRPARRSSCAAARHQGGRRTSTSRNDSEGSEPGDEPPALRPFDDVERESRARVRALWLRRAQRTTRRANPAANFTTCAAGGLA